jgi:hypothetical protein
VAPAPEVPLAVKVCVALEQIDAAGAVTLVMAGALFTVIVTVLEVAGEPVAHVAFDVITAVTTSLFASDAFV